MCGRFTHLYTWRQLHRLLSLTSPEVQLDLRYNVAPTQQAPIVRDDGRGGRELVMARWGLVPFWAADLKAGSRAINARCETIVTAPTFRAAMKARRCIVPVSGFYEWKSLPGGGKAPQYITRADCEPVLFAGLWERWRDKTAPEAAPVDTFTIATVEGAGALREVHDRAPAVLEPEEVAAWLDVNTPVEKARQMLDAPADGVLTGHEVSTKVNSPRNEGPELIVAG